MTSFMAKRRLRSFYLPAATLWLAVGFLVGAAPMRAVEPSTKDNAGKPAWQWTLDERLAKRFDPEARRARIAAKIAAEATYKTEAEAAEAAGDFAEKSRREDLDVINGRRNPELFLPVELFNILLLNAFPPGGIDPAGYRGMIEPHAAALGFGADFWLRLGRVAAPVLDFEREREKLAKTNPARLHRQEGSEINAEEISACRDRAEALVKAETEFGKEPFLRLLYDVIAPSSEVTYSLRGGIVEQARAMERGCQ